MERWLGHIEAGVRRMGLDDRVALQVFAALQGGLLLMRAQESLEPLEAALDGVLTILHGSSSTLPA
jgi:hypothetical protein